MSNKNGTFLCIAILNALLECKSKLSENTIVMRLRNGKEIQYWEQGHDNEQNLKCSQTRSLPRTDIIKYWYKWIKYSQFTWIRNNSFPYRQTFSIRPRQSRIWELTGQKEMTPFFKKRNWKEILTVTVTSNTHQGLGWSSVCVFEIKTNDMRSPWQVSLVMLCDPIFWVCWWNPEVWPFRRNLLSSIILWNCLLCCTRWIYLLRL